MPHVNIKMYTGRTEQEKATLAEAVSKTVIAVLNTTEESVSVSIEDVAPAEWAREVYRPEIVEKSDSVYKKPGYNPFDVDL